MNNEIERYRKLVRDLSESRNELIAEGRDMQQAISKQNKYIDELREKLGSAYITVGLLIFPAVYGVCNFLLWISS